MGICQLSSPPFSLHQTFELDEIQQTSSPFQQMVWNLLAAGRPHLSIIGSGTRSAWPRVPRMNFHHKNKMTLIIPLSSPIKISHPAFTCSMPRHMTCRLLFISADAFAQISAPT